MHFGEEGVNVKSFSVCSLTPRNWQMGPKYFLPFNREGCALLHFRSEPRYWLTEAPEEKGAPFRGALCHFCVQCRVTTINALALTALIRKTIHIYSMFQ